MKTRVSSDRLYQNVDYCKILYMYTNEPFDDIKTRQDKTKQNKELHKT